MRANRAGGVAGGAAAATPRPARSALARYLDAHLWKLPVLTASTLFFGTFAAATLSVVLRPARPYILPLLADVAAHAPERHVLRVAFAAASPLLALTLAGCVLHARELRRGGGSVAAMPPTPRRMRAAEGGGAAARRRVARVAARSAMVALAIGALGALTLAAQLDVLSALRASSLRIAMPWLRRQLAYNALLMYWVCASVMLMWYFHRLQAVPPAAADADEDPVRELLDAVWLPTWMRGPGQWLRANMRAICVTGQAVCVFKILGLWFALKNFSISRRRLIKLGLLATLAFAEYSATVFFSLFLVVLALDIRARVGRAEGRGPHVPGPCAPQVGLTPIVSPGRVGP